ncbi:hypothetical protein G9P44_004031 [Scheffersomyces stipitis]|nr:hypothetical protein G9P44_004031 [Scheffersomyces stipitis]
MLAYNFKYFAAETETDSWVSRAAVEHKWQIRSDWSEEPSPMIRAVGDGWAGMFSFADYCGTDVALGAVGAKQNADVGKRSSSRSRNRVFEDET